MSRRRPDHVDVLAVSEQDPVDEEGQGWTLRYLLVRIRIGAAATFAVRVHAQPHAPGMEQCALAGLDVRDAAAAEALFQRLAEGAVFPVHLQDIVRDAMCVTHELPAAAAMAPPAD